MQFFPDSLTLLSYYEMGGFVMPPLILVGILLWYALIYRIMNVRTSGKSARELIKLAKSDNLTEDTVTARAANIAVSAARKANTRKELKSIISEHFGYIRTELNHHRALVRVTVIIAPLLGLLGTIDGMIETFKSLGDMALFSASGGIAGGISRALFTTQMGLAISIPGVMIGRMVDRKQQNINRELDQIKDLVWVYKTKD